MNSWISVEKKRNTVPKCLSTFWKFRLSSSRALICLQTQTKALKSALYIWIIALQPSFSPVLLETPVPRCSLPGKVRHGILAARYGNQPSPGSSHKSWLPAVSWDWTKPVLAAASFLAFLPFIKRFLFIKKTVIAAHIKNSESFQQGRDFKCSVSWCHNEDNNGPCIQRLLQGDAFGVVRPWKSLQGTLLMEKGGAGERSPPPTQFGFLRQHFWPQEAILESSNVKRS